VTYDLLLNVANDLFNFVGHVNYWNGGRNLLTSYTLKDNLQRATSVNSVCSSWC